MNKTYQLTILAFIALSTSPATSYAEPKIGASINGGIFLYRDSIEMYWNDWLAFPLMNKADIPTSSQARATIIGEGKTAAFIGNISINCENGQHFWESAGNGSEFLASEREAEEIVPVQAIKNSVKLFCKRTR
ncbi:hypothetical protein SAMN05421644_15116 [Allochromatium warmingii]|uniref:Uncharacterized protein n=1 Tax=Allochromatium warmingii TaxID=61595 RepID=A0A1H3J1M3_ALLWA|nr:hypothetical protein [Allochromatium warmingii]SDY33903.1 hypothetical protein SAMN05421644_15116 [Allochromatium warmingii]